MKNPKPNMSGDTDRSGGTVRKAKKTWKAKTAQKGGGAQCSPEWLREWYLWEDPEDDEDLWYYWEYKWCQTPGEEDWVKSYGDWHWYAPAGEDDEVDEVLEGLSE
jgi:hypothetical protein